MLNDDVDPMLSDMTGPVPQPPRSSGSVRLDEAFVAVDFAIEEETASTFTKRSASIESRPSQKRGVRECRTRAALDALDALMLKSVGL